MHTLEGVEYGMGWFAQFMKSLQLLHLRCVCVRAGGGRGGKG